jgi:hypothetical protein
VGQLTARQLQTRRRIETVIRLMAPALDLVLAAGDRLSRIVERDDVEYYPPRVTRATDGSHRGGAGRPTPSRSTTLPPR